MISREKSRHCQTWLECWMKTYSESRIELRNLQILKKMLENLEAALWAEELGRCLENYRSWKKYPRKTCGYGQPRGHLIRVLNERSVNDGGEFCLLCGWWFSNQLDIVSETHFSCDTVDHGLWLAILSSLLCPETDRIIRIGKQGYYFILLILRSDVLMFHSWHQSACLQLFWHWEKLFFKIN